ILCTNRDEFLDRPTEDAHFHAFGAALPPGAPPPVLAGRDLQAGGSWFGINRAGRVALLTNITEPAQKYTTSRGALVSAFLLATPPTHQSLEDELAALVPPDARFAGFNLLLFAPAPPASVSTVENSAQTPISYEALLVTNHGGGGALAARPLRPDECACGGVSNGVDGAGDAPWPKVQHATAALAEALASTTTTTTSTSSSSTTSTTAPNPTPPNPTSPATYTPTESALLHQLFALLAWHPPRAIAHRSELRHTVHVLPVPIVLDGPGSTHPRAAYYGTRLASALLVRRDGAVLFVERDVWGLGGEDGDGKGKPVLAEPPTERVFRFVLGGGLSASDICASR
ncbi:hypothetical protein HYPSUDRAFT_137965, partial [Hypholoma sublateritium FD-334 SS-4]